MNGKKHLIIGCTVLLSLSFSFSAYATPSNASLSDQLNSVNREAAAVKDEIDNKQAAAKELTEKKEQAYNEWKKISLEVADLEVKIFEQTSQLLQMKERISELEKKAKESKESLDRRFKVISNRLLALQEQDSNYNMLSVILESKSFGDFINRALTVSYLMSADKDLIDTYEKELNTYNQLKADANTELEKMKQVQAELNQSKYDLEVQQQKKNALMKNLEKQYGWTVDSIKSLQVEQVQLTQQSESIKGRIEQEEKEKEKQQVIQDQNNTNESSQPSSGKGYDVRNLSNVTAAGIDRVLKGKLQGYGSAFYNVGHSYGINPAFMASIAMAETGGNSKWLNKYNNIGGFISNGGPMSFNSIDDSIKYMGSLLTRLYLQDGLYTVEDIHTRYAPVGADTDPNNLNGNWVKNVYKYMGMMGVPI